MATMAKRLENASILYCRSSNPFVMVNQQTVTVIRTMSGYSALYCSVAVKPVSGAAMLVPNKPMAAQRPSAISILLGSSSS